MLRNKQMQTHWRNNTGEMQCRIFTQCRHVFDLDNNPVTDKNTLLESLNNTTGLILDTDQYLQFKICKVDRFYICSFLWLPTWTMVVTLLQQVQCEL